jgi:hypothetical protein
LYRVLSVEPGLSLTLEDVFGGERLEVASQHVSREAVRWDVLLARVMRGRPATLWGPARTLEPRDEDELRALLEQRAGAPLEELDERERAAAFRRHALELMRFVPARASLAPSFFTPEGDPVVFASATWRVRDLPALRKRLRSLGGLSPEEPVEIDLTLPRASLMEGRPALPPGAVILESSPVEAPGVIHVATLRLEGDTLHAEAISEQRLADTLELVAEDLAGLVELADLEAVPVDEARAAHGADGGRPRTNVSRTLDGDERLLVAGLLTERLRTWLDEPHPLLDGCTPREAAASERRADVVGILRQLENGAERARRRHEPAVDVASLRAELRLGNELAA